MEFNSEQDFLSIVSESINTGQEYLPQLIKGIDILASLIRNGQWDEAHNIFSHILEGLEWLATVIDSIARLSHLVEVTEDYNSKMADFRTTINNFLEAYAGKDNVLMADILEYELIDNINYWIEAFRVMGNVLKNQQAI